MPLIDVRIAVIFALAFPIASQPATGQTSAALAGQVREAEARFATTMTARDFAAFGTYLADEAVFFSRSGPLRGKTAVLDGWRPFFERATPPFTWQPDSIEVLDSGTLALSSGPVLDGTGRRMGTFNSVWRREADGRWRVVFDKGCRVTGVSPILAQSTDEKAVLATVERVFQGMRTADSAMVRSAFAEGARFAGLDSAGAIRYASLDGWIRAIANSAGRWEEPLYDVQVRVDETMAQVWAPYTFYLDKQVRHCGIDAFELLRTAAGWKITQISDTQRRQGCPDPLKSR